MKAIIFGLLLTAGLAQSQNNGTVSYYVTPRDQGKLLKVGPQGTEPVPICETLRGMIKLNSDGSVGFDVYQITRDSQTTLDYNATNDPDCVNSGMALNPSGDTFIIDLPRRNSVGDPTHAEFLKYTAFNYGVSTINLRFRGKDNNGRKVVGTSLGLAYNAGFSRGFVQITPKRLVHYYLSLGGFVGASSSELNATTVTNKDTWISTDKFTNPTIAYGTCLTIARNNLGFVVTYGWERMLGADRERWIYNNKPWVGIGLTAGLGYF